MQFLTTIAVLASVAAAAYEPCPNGKGKPVCCTLGADGIELLCIPPLFPPSSLKGFKNRCSFRTPQCCEVSVIGVAALGCSEPAGDTPPPPAYNPCPKVDTPSAFCCKRDLIDNINCKDGPVNPTPKSFDDFTATCKAQDSNRPYCCARASDGEPILCGAAQKPM